MGCHIEIFYLHRFSSSAFSSNFAVVVMFSATDVAQMVWDSDSDDGEMEGGSDVEIEEHVSSFFCKNYCFHHVAKKVKVGCQFIASASTELDYDRSMYIDSITCVIFTLNCCWHYLEVWHISTMQWLVRITNNYTFLWLCWIQLLSNSDSCQCQCQFEYMCTWQFLSGCVALLFCWCYF